MVEFTGVADLLRHWVIFFHASIISAHSLSGLEMRQFTNTGAVWCTLTTISFRSNFDHVCKSTENVYM